MEIGVTITALRGLNENLADIDLIDEAAFFDDLKRLKIKIGQVGQMHIVHKIIVFVVAILSDFVKIFLNKCINCFFINIMMIKNRKQ